MSKPPDGILSACNSSARLTSLQTRNCKIESRRDGLFSQPTERDQVVLVQVRGIVVPDRNGTRAVGGVKAERVQPRSLTVRLHRTKVYVKFMSTGDRLLIKVYEMTLPDM